jgi:release factor glutamine methyltransferase
MSETWTVRTVLGWTTEYLAKRGIDSPRLTAEMLLAHALRLSRVYLYTDLDRPLVKAERAGFRSLIERRAAGEPTHYLIGAREFYNRSFAVDPRVLIPRPETELLVESVLRAVPKDRSSQLLDVCTGSGCIAVSLAAERPQASVWATELSTDACEVARANALANKVDGRIKVLQGDLFEPLAPGVRFDAVVSNPPYVSSGEIAGLSAEVRREPLTALDGGADGLALLRRIIAGAGSRLKPGGLLALEIGEKQGEAVLDLLRRAGYANARIEKDLARLDRLALGNSSSSVQADG